MMQNHEGLHCFTPLLTFEADNRRIRHRRMVTQYVFNLFGEDAR